MQLLSAKKKNLAGFSTATSQFCVGYLELTDVFQSTPPSLRTHACRVIAARSTLAARIDSRRGEPTGKAGQNLLEEIHKIEKWQEPPPAKLPKPLSVPDSMPKKKRGGLLLWKMKERYAQADVMKLANRRARGELIRSEVGNYMSQLVKTNLLLKLLKGRKQETAGQNKLAAKVAKRLKGKKIMVAVGLGQDRG